MTSHQANASDAPTAHSAVDDRAQFEQLSRQWQDILHGRASRVADRQRRQAAQWRAEFAELERRAGALKAQGRWVRGPSDLLSVIGRDRDELTHSRMLAWLLDPSGNHDLGAGLLQRLVQHVGIDGLSDEDAGRARIRREVPHPDGRADLLIYLPGARIVIENKIDAGEQPDQCARMVRAFDTAETAFVFLTLHGHQPHTAGASRDRWTALSYTEVAAWLQDLTAETSSQRRHAARSYLATLRRLTG